MSKEETCCWGRCSLPSASIRIEGRSRLGYCDKHLTSFLAKEERESEKRFKKYYRIKSVDPVERHIEEFGGYGGCFAAWPIRYAISG